MKYVFVGVVLLSAMGGFPLARAGCAGSNASVTVDAFDETGYGGDHFQYEIFLNASSGDYEAAVTDVSTWWSNKISAVDTTHDDTHWWTYGGLDCSSFLEDGYGDKDELDNNDQAHSLRFQCPTDEPWEYFTYCEGYGCNTNSGRTKVRVYLYRRGSNREVVLEVAYMDTHWDNIIKSLQTGMNGDVGKDHYYWYFYEGQRFNNNGAPDLILSDTGQQDEDDVGSLEISSFRLVLTDADTAPNLQASLPEGFRLEPVAAGLSEPSALDDTPDGRIFIAERTSGKLREMYRGQLKADPVCSVSVNASGDGGLLGVAVHPDYAENGWVYLYFTDLTSGKNKVVRYTIEGASCSGAKDILADLGAGGSGRRNGGGIGFGPDDKLYVATGDMEDTGSAQDDESYQGKVLRVTDGDPVEVVIVAMGVRDGRGLAVGEAGQVYMSDAGDDGDTAHDELHLAADEGNLGWPAETGPGGMYDQPLGAFLPTVGIHGVADYDGTLYPNEDADGKDNDHDSYGPDRYPGVKWTDDNEAGVCIGSHNNGEICTTHLDCTPVRSGEAAHYCEKKDDPAEHCPGSGPYGDDDCDDAGEAGIDEPDESYWADVFAAGRITIERGVLIGAGDVASNWTTFIDSSFLSDCPTGWTGLMTGRNGYLYALATNSGGATGGLYKIVYDQIGPREVSGPDSYVPLQMALTGTGDVEVLFEDIRDDAMQVQDNGAVAQSPVREYTVWRGAMGTWYSHVAAITAVQGTELTPVLRKVTLSSTTEDEYYLVSARNDNLEGTLGDGAPGPRPGPPVTDLCDILGAYGEDGHDLFECGQDFTLIDTHGRERSLHELRGRPVLLDLTAEWCPHCVSEANELQTLWEEHEDRGPQFITILTDEESSGSDWDGRPTPAECRLWEDRPGSYPDHTFECWADPLSCTGDPCNNNYSQEAMPKYRHDDGDPVNVILDQGLRVVWRSIGWSSAIRNDIRATMDTLVGTAPTCLH